MESNKAGQLLAVLLERAEKVGTLSRDKHNHCGTALFCVFLPTPLFQSKTGSAEDFVSALRRFSLKVSRRRRMSACVTIFYFLPLFLQTETVQQPITAAGQSFYFFGLK